MPCSLCMCELGVAGCWPHSCGEAKGLSLLAAACEAKGLRLLAAACEAKGLSLLAAACVGAGREMLPEGGHSVVDLGRRLMT